MNDIDQARAKRLAGQPPAASITWLGEHGAEWAAHYGGRAAPRGYTPDMPLYQERLDAIACAEAFMCNDRARYDTYRDTRDPHKLAHALAYVAGMLAADCAADDMKAAGEKVPDDPRDPKFLAAVENIMDGLRDRALVGLDVAREDAARMRANSKSTTPQPPERTS